MQVNEGKIQITQNLNSLLDQFNNWYDVDTIMGELLVTKVTSFWEHLVVFRILQVHSLYLTYRTKLFYHG